MMRQTKFNNFDGDKVVGDLLAHKELWRGVIMVRQNLLMLRDIEMNIWNADTVYIYPAWEQEVALEQLSKSWTPSKTFWTYYLLMECYPSQRILRLWWD